MKKLTAIFSCLFVICIWSNVQSQDFELTPKIRYYEGSEIQVASKKVKSQKFNADSAFTSIQEIKLVTENTNNINYQFGKYLSTAYSDRFYKIKIDAFGNFIFGGSKGYGTNDGDAIIYKYDSAGNFKWVNIPAESSGFDEIYGIETDALGNVYITGRYYSSAFNSSLASRGGADIFVAKYDPDGTLLWARSAGGSDSDYGSDVTVDDLGNVYVMGFFKGISNWSGISKTSSTQGDMFIAKYDNEGNIKWVRTGDGGSYNYLYEISVDKSGNSYVSANFSNTMQFEGAPVVTSVGGTDIFIIKYDTNGNYNWIKTAGGVSDDGGNSVAVDNEGNVFVAGYFSDNARFGDKNLTAHGSFDIFCAKYSANGNLLWVKQLGGTGSQTAWGVCTDEKNNCYLTGWFSGSGALDNTSVVSEGAEDAYLIKYDRNGNLIWVEPTATGISKQVGGDVSVQSNKIAVAGYYEGEMNIQGSVFPNSGDEDAYMAVFEQLENVQTSKIVNPGLSLSISRIEAGQSIVFSGTQFSSLGKVDLNFSGPELINPVINYQINLAGNFQYTFTTSSLQKTGEYNVTATDKISGKTVTRKFEVIKDPTTVVDNDLIIIEPNNSRIRYVGEPLRIAWTDKVKFNVNPLFNYKHSYKIEYKIDTETQSGSWQVFKDTTATNIGYGKIDMFKLFTPSKEGKYTFKITDNYYPNRNVSTPDITIGKYVNQDFIVDFKWDKNSKRMYSTPEGAAADGVARFYMVVSNRNNVTNNIKSVKVSLSDGNNQNPKYLGKVKYCSTQNDLEFTDEANESNSITAENLSSNVDGKYWFWYVAPDDFSRNESEWDKGIRIVTATFEITLTNGTTITPITKEITIVRPPLMLVHGLNDNPSCWDGFKIGANKPIYFNETNAETGRFKVINAPAMLGKSHFDVNANLLLASIDTTYDSRSFEYTINQIRQKGYACNQVDYVCHSMGGSMLRAAADKENIFKRTSNYSKGFIHKFITLNTPHQGSSLANVLEHLEGDPLSYLDLGGSSLSNIVPQFYNLKGIIPRVTDAVYDLKFKGGVKFNKLEIPSNLIGGGTDCSNLNSTIKGLLMAIRINRWGLFFDGCDFWTDYFRNYNLETTFTEGSDGVVSLTSQFNGEYVNNLPTFCTKVNDALVHSSGLGSPYPTANEEVFNKVNVLLNTDVESDAFGYLSSTGTNNTGGGSRIPSVNKANAIKYSIDNTKLKVIYPIENQQYNSEDTMAIKIKVDTVGLKQITVYFQDQIISTMPSDTIMLINLTVNPDYIEQQTLNVVGTYKLADQWSRSVYPTKITVNPKGSIIDFKIKPDLMVIQKGYSDKPTYEAVFPGSISEISKTNLFTIAITDPTIVSYVDSTNTFEGLAEGITNATITYRGITKTVFIEVLDPKEPVVETPNAIENLNYENNSLIVNVYPNPFSENITFEFTLPKSGNTRIEVYNVYGVKVKEIDFGHQSEGFIRKTINMKELVTGIYIYRLTSGLFIQNGSVIKM